MPYRAFKEICACGALSKLVTHPTGRNLKQPELLRFLTVYSTNPRIFPLYPLAIQSPSYKKTIEPMVILHAPPYVKSMFVYISVNMRQFIVNSIVINCHRRGTCPKIATRSQQESTKVKKRTPPARPKNVRQKKNKPISGNPFPFSQLTARQQLRKNKPV